MSDSTKTKLSERDLHIVAAAWNCTKDPIQIDYDKLAAAVGYANSNSARSNWFLIKKKLQKLESGEESTITSPPKKKDVDSPQKTPKKRTGKGEKEQESPTKKAKKGAPKKMDALDEELLEAAEPVKEGDVEVSVKTD